MSLWVCKECTTRYSVGAPKCPHCGAVDRTDMAGNEIDATGEVVAPAETVEAGDSDDSAKAPADKATPAKASTK